MDDRSFHVFQTKGRPEAYSTTMIQYGVVNTGARWLSPCQTFVNRVLVRRQEIPPICRKQRESTRIRAALYIKQVGGLVCKLIK